MGFQKFCFKNFYPKTPDLDFDCTFELIGNPKMKALPTSYTYTIASLPTTCEEWNQAFIDLRSKSPAALGLSLSEATARLGELIDLLYPDEKIEGLAAYLRTIDGVKEREHTCTEDQADVKLQEKGGDESRSEEIAESHGPESSHFSQRRSSPTVPKSSHPSIEPSPAQSPLRCLSSHRRRSPKKSNTLLNYFPRLTPKPVPKNSILSYFSISKTDLETKSNVKIEIKLGYGNVNLDIGMEEAGEEDVPLLRRRDIKRPVEALEVKSENQPLQTMDLDLPSLAVAPSNPCHTYVFKHHNVDLDCNSDDSDDWWKRIDSEPEVESEMEDEFGSESSGIAKITQSVSAKSTNVRNGEDSGTARMGTQTEMQMQIQTQTITTEESVGKRKRNRRIHLDQNPSSSLSSIIISISSGSDNPPTKPRKLAKRTKKKKKL